jgi:hypothetical protein
VFTNISLPPVPAELFLNAQEEKFLKEKFQKNHKIILKHNVINKQVIDC